MASGASTRPLITGGRIHNYGHGGAGITLSWGCADDVTAMVAQIAAVSPATP